MSEAHSKPRLIFEPDGNILSAHCNRMTVLMVKFAIILEQWPLHTVLLKQQRRSCLHLYFICLCTITKVEPKKMKNIYFGKQSTDYNVKIQINELNNF